MNVKEAVVIAKKYLADLLVDEQMQNLGLEEVEFDDDENAWRITLGFSRPWNNTVPSAMELALRPLDAKREPWRRDYRVVLVGDADGVVRSVKLHDWAA